jgi:FlaA1/EpsC-like NDP-sugar epimerase
VGIRAGEKLHEEMITESDSYNTIEFDKYFAILPSNSDKKKFIDHFNGWEVPKGFKYNSGTNTEWETVMSLRNKIRLFVDTNFKIIE